MRKELDDFKSKCDIAKVVSHYVSLEKAGSNYRGLCPFHEEKTPSFYVNPEKGFFHCFGCGAGGDVIEFVKKIENISFIEAVQRVAEICGIDPPAMSNDAFYSKYILLMESVSKAYNDVLLSARGKRAWNYLTKSRGLDKKDVEKFDLGYAPIDSDVVVHEAQKLKIDVETLIKNGLIVRSRNGRLREFFQDRLIFPIRNSSGKVIAFGGRALGEGIPKYVNSSENKYFSKSRVLYLFNLARYKVKEAGFVMLCEGYMDAIAFHRNGFENACAVLGTGLTKFHLNTLKRVTDNLLLVLDSDSAGMLAMERAAKVLADEGFNVKVLTFDSAKDPDEFFSTHGKEEFKKIINGAVDYWDFYVQRVLGEIGDPTKAVYRFKRATSWIASPILKRHLISKVSKILMVDEKDIMYNLQTTQMDKSSYGGKSIRMTLDDYIVYLLFLNEEMRSKIIIHLESNVLSPFAKKALEIVKSGVIQPQDAMKLMTRENGERFFQIFTRDDSDLDAERIFEVCISKLEERKMKHQIEVLEREMISTPDRERKAKLIKKAMELRSLLKKKGGASNGGK